MPKKKAYLVMSREPRVLETGLQTGKGRLKFKKGKNAMNISDPALAEEIDSIHGLKGSGAVWVHEDPMTEPWLRDDGVQGMGIHRYFWGASPRYASAWEKFEKRRKEKLRKEKKAKGDKCQTTLPTQNLDPNPQV